MTTHTISNKKDAIGLQPKTFGNYAAGFILCLILTAIPFYMVMQQLASKLALVGVVMVTAVLQFFVQVLCFLRVNYHSKQGQLNTLALAFTTIVLVVIIGGSMWIMANLDYFMMH